MTTVRTICTRALRRAGIVGGIETPSAEDAVAALDLLNEMVRGWAVNGVDVLLQSDFTLDSTFVYWVPPIEAESDTIGLVAYQGTWNATTNSPALASSTGTQGYVYKVATAGSTTLDDVTSWSVDDYLVYDGTEWLKGISSARFDAIVSAMLVVKLTGEYGIAVKSVHAAEARSGWASMVTYYAKPPTATFDQALISMPSRSRAVNYGEPNE